MDLPARPRRELTHRTLLLAAVEGEAVALLAGLGHEAALLMGPHAIRRCGFFDVAVTGVGTAAAAVAATDLLARLRPAAVVSVGVAGAFGPAVGSLVVGSASLAAELGREAGPAVVPFALAPHVLPLLAVPPARATAAFAAHAQVVTGVIATVSTVTTSQARADLLGRAAVAEAMEGFGVATAAAALGVPCGEWRTISNAAAGPWDLPAGLAALTLLGKALSA